MLANCSLAIQSKYRRKVRCEKIIIPFGAPADQTINLVRLTARDVYSVHFDKPEAFLSGGAVLEEAEPANREASSFLDFIWKHHLGIEALLRATRRLPA